VDSNANLGAKHPPLSGRGGDCLSPELVELFTYPDFSPEVDTTVFPFTSIVVGLV